MKNKAFSIRLETLGADFLASIVVLLVAIPLCMGIAIASGAPPATGLITGIVGGIIVGSISGSPLLVSGPAAGLAVIVYQFLEKYDMAAFGTVVLVAGLIQVAAGAMGLGRWFRAISPAVIHGMLAGIGVLIFAAQFHVMIDDSPRGSGLVNLLTIPAAIYKGFFSGDSIHRQAAWIGALSIAVIFAWNRFRPRPLKFLPAPLVAVVFATTAAYFGGLSIQRVDVPSNLFDVMIFPTVDRFVQTLVTPGLLMSAVALAFIASAETLLSASAVDKMHSGPRTRYNRELFAQGVGNSICGFLGALPMTGVIVRSGANVQAGAKTRLSTILHGIWLLAFVVAFPTLLAMIPTAGLAAILVYTGYRLVDVAHIRRLAEYGKTEVLIYVATVAAIVSIDLIAGILIGLGLSLAKLLYTISHLKLDLTHDEANRRATLVMEGSATFLVLPKLAAALEKVPQGTELHLEIEKLDYIDHACLDLLGAWEASQKSSGGGLVVEWSHLNGRYHRLNARPELSLSKLSPKNVLASRGGKNGEDAGKSAAGSETVSVVRADQPGGAGDARSAVIGETDAADRSLSKTGD